MVGGIAALRALRGAGFVPAKPIEVVMFTSEEPTRFGLSCSGSRAMAGALCMLCAALHGVHDVCERGFGRDSVSECEPTRFGLSCSGSRAMAGALLC